MISPYLSLAISYHSNRYVVNPSGLNFTEITNRIIMTTGLLCIFRQFPPVPPIHNARIYDVLQMYLTTIFNKKTFCHPQSVSSLLIRIKEQYRHIYQRKKPLPNGRGFETDIDHASSDSFAAKRAACIIIAHSRRFCCSLQEIP